MPNKLPSGRITNYISSRSAGFAGATLAMMTLVVLLALCVYEYQKTITTDRERLEMQARVLADHATRSIESASVVLAYLADQISGEDLIPGQYKVDPMLAQALAALPYMRSLNLLDATGLVRSSSSPTDMGARIHLANLGALPSTGQEKLGGFLPGRGLSALTLAVPRNTDLQALPASTGVGFIPLIRAVKIGGQRFYLVALINPDSFASFQLLTLNNPKASAYLVSYQGELLASSGPHQVALGSQLHEHPVFSTFLPSVEHTSYVGTGTTPHEQVVAFRLSRTRPVVVVVEQAYADSLWRWMMAIRWFSLAALVTMAFLLLMTLAMQRSLRAREAAQGALQHQLGFVALLLDVIPLPVATIDTAGCYVTVNRAWEDFMGQPREQVIGKSNHAFMSPALVALHARQDLQLWQSGGTVRYESTMDHMDGSHRDIVVTKVLVPGDRYHPALILSSSFDVSEFRTAARATQQARDAAEESSRAKSEFIANISHELRTPLQSILGFSELGMMRSATTPKLQSMFTDIHASGDRMLALVNDLLDVSKIESSVGTVALERADVRSLVDAVLRELSPQLAAKQIHLSADLGDIPLLAKVDPMRFAQVIRNVTANAIKFSPPRSQIEITGRHINDEVSASAQLCLSVRDHGAGIPPDELELIFDAFVQSSLTKDGSGGTGLGLAICRRILDAHNGRIVAANMPDGGAIFRIYLPARKAIDRETDFATMA